MDIERKPFQGVLNILSFNRHFYVIGLIVLAIIITSWSVFEWPTTLLYIIVIAFTYGFLMPLIISAYVYDFSGYYKLDWLNTIKTAHPDINSIVNIHAGFDETSFVIKDHFPEAKLQVFDFYNSDAHTEPAIVRARKVSIEYLNTKLIKTDLIPMTDNSTDIVFLLSTAHEIRAHKEKVIFLKECHRILKPNGRVIMVEHLRDSPNFFAFTIGFTHFFSRKTWKKAYLESGFSSVSETKFTAFMSIFNCTK